MAPIACPVCGCEVDTRRFVLSAQTPAIEKFVRASAEADENIIFGQGPSYEVLAKQLRINDRKLLDAAYDEEITVMEQRVEFKTKPFRRLSMRGVKSMPAPRKSNLRIWWSGDFSTR